jgi:hypothetical protein
MNEEVKFDSRQKKESRSGLQVRETNTHLHLVSRPRMMELYLHGVMLN